VQVIATNNTGCADTASSTVHVYATPISNFLFHNGVEQVYADMQAIQMVNTSFGAITYAWDFGNGENSNEFEPELYYSNPGYYNISLVVENEFGCRDTAYKQIEVIVPEQIFSPNAFTPNGDTKNDYFSVAYNNIVSAKVRIFNRWGEEIYYTEDLDFKWDGTYKGRAVQDAVYVYTIDAIGYYGTTYHKTGRINVVH